MKHIKVSSDVVFRNYDDVTILYNIIYKNYVIINSLGSDIWNFISENHDGVIISDIVSYIDEECQVDKEVIFEDVNNFVDHLFVQNLISVDGVFDIPSVKDLISPSENDIEGQIITFYQDRCQIYSATFELTYACNEKCIHCYATSPIGIQPVERLDVERCKHLIDELFQMKCFHLIFTGGDPFVFNGFLELLEYARLKCFSFDIYTNGQFLANNPSVINQIAKLYPRTFYISLYGATAEVNDGITQVKGSFDKTISAIKMLKQVGISIVLNVMLMKPNYSEAKMIIDLASQMGVEHRIGLSLIRKNNGDNSPLEYFIDDEAVIEDILRITNGNVVSMDVGASSNQSELLCGAGTTSLCISPNGDVYPCVSLKRKLGSIFYNNLVDIWNNLENKKYVYSLAWKNTKKCKKCKYQSVGPHCIGLSDAECGDVFECNYCDRIIAQCLYRISSKPTACDTWEN